MIGSSIRKDEQLSAAECQQLCSFLASKQKNMQNCMSLLCQFNLIRKIKDYRSKVRELLESMQVMRFQKGDVVYSKTTSKTFNLMLRGCVTIWGYEQNAVEETLIQTRKSGYFGHSYEVDNIEISVIVSEDDTYLLQLPLKSMYKIFQGFIVFPEFTEMYNFYRRLPFFKDIEKKKILKMVEATEKMIYELDNTVYNEGEWPQFLYIVFKGQVTLYKKANCVDIAMASVTVSELLGIEDIISNNKFSYTVKASTQNCTIMQIPKQTVLQAFQQTPFPLKVYDFRAKIRQHRVDSAMKRKSQSRNLSIDSQCHRANFREKQRIYTEAGICVAKIANTSYLTNKKQRQFENEEEFYQDRISQMETLVRRRYGHHQNKYYDIFEDYPLKSQKNMLQMNRRRTLGPKKQASKIPVKTAFDIRRNSANTWKRKSFNSYETQSTNYKKRLLDVEDAEIRLAERHIFL